MCDVVKGLLQCISRRDRVLPSRMTGMIFASTRSGDLVSGLPNLGRASSDLEAVSLFPGGVYEGGEEGAHQLGAPVNYFSPGGPELFFRAPRRECNIITFLFVLQTSVCGELLPRSRRISWESFYYLSDTQRRGHGIACSGIMAWMKMYDCFWKSVNGDKT